VGRCSPSSRGSLARSASILDDAEVRVLATPVDTDRLVAQIDETAGGKAQDTTDPSRKREEP
jgi:hypothetical protein